MSAVGGCRANSNDNKKEVSSSRILFLRLDCTHYFIYIFVLIYISTLYF